MYEILNDISERVRRVLSKDYSHETGDFKRGFRYCQALFSIGIDRSAGELKRANTRYNQGQRIKELEREIGVVKYKLNYLKENHPKTDLENDERIINIILSLAKSNHKRFGADRKEERELITEIFERYI